MQNYEVWIMIAFFLLEVILRIIPSETDNSILKWVVIVIEAILPSRSSDGKRFVTKTEKREKNTGLS